MLLQTDKLSMPAYMASNSIFHILNGIFICAIGATEDEFPRLNAMPNNTAAAVPAGRCQRMDGAFETVKDMGFTAKMHFKGFGIIIPTHFTYRHAALLYR
jgi:hypothetical protein